MRVRPGGAQDVQSEVAAVFDPLAALLGLDGPTSLMTLLRTRKMPTDVGGAPDRAAETAACSFRSGSRCPSGRR